VTDKITTEIQNQEQQKAVVVETMLKTSGEKVG